MFIEGIIWIRGIVNKLAFKHHVEVYEVEGVLANKPEFRFVQKGEQEDEDVYLALGRTDAGRYLSIFFIYKRTKEALVLSARDMAEKERKRYAKKRNKEMPKFKLLDELVDFFDNNDLGEYMDEMPKVDFEVNIKKRTHIFALDDELVSKLTEISQTEHTSPEALINIWLKEKIQEHIHR